MIFIGQIGTQLHRIVLRTNVSAITVSDRGGTSVDVIFFSYPSFDLPD